MPAYEVMFIFKPELSEEQQQKLVGELENILKENKVNIENSQPYGKRRLAYEIKKSREGLYYLMNFSASDGSVCKKLNHACNINENILRVLMIKKEAKAR
ncbi:MAG: 30S ribosomal protein S6 [Candidatus Omnitrophica bacterium]|nr:30S ribosomal protein S6 [Candidatus Omnitrophota bacterium]